MVHWTEWHGRRLAGDLHQRRRPHGRGAGYEGWNAALYHEEASDVANWIEAISRRIGLNIVLESTMRTFASAVARVAAFKKAGYRVNIAFMDCKPETSAKRALSGS